MVYTTRTTTKKTDSELAVITKARDLLCYTLGATERAPKKYRFTLSARLQNLALDVLEQLIRANETYIAYGAKNAEEMLKLRLARQKEALCSLKLLCNIAVIAKEHGALTIKQLEQITKQASETIGLTIRWAQSDRRRHENNTERNKQL